MIADERHKAASLKLASDEGIALPFDNAQFLILRTTYRQNQPPTIRKLHTKWLWHLWRRGGNKYGVERSELRKSERAIAAMHVNIAISETLEPRGSRGSKLRTRFDCENRVCQLRKDGSLITATRSDFQDTLVARELQRRRHRGNDIRLGDGLTLADRQWSVFVGTIPKFTGYELFPPDGSHRRKHARINDSAAPQLLFDHFGALRGKLVRVGGRPQRSTNCVIAK